MNKETFLRELQKHLEILEDREQQDILEEYAQHIDIKIQNGQSEEDAIRDFGPVTELAGEILEAYHVKPAFGESRKKKGLPGIPEMNLKEEARKLTGFGDGLKKGWTALRRGAGRTFHGVCQAVKNFFFWISGPFRGKQKTENHSTGIFRRILTEIARLIFWCLRFCWNLFWMVLTLGSGFCALMLLFSLGVVMILLFQEYPLGGASLICLGGFLAAGSISGLCFSLIRRKEKKERNDEPEQGRQEVEA